MTRESETYRRGDFGISIVSMDSKYVERGDGLRNAKILDRESCTSSTREIIFSEGVICVSLGWWGTIEMREAYSRYR